jgi:hypothetical protein
MKEYPPVTDILGINAEIHKHQGSEASVVSEMLMRSQSSKNSM